MFAVDKNKQDAQKIIKMKMNIPHNYVQSQIESEFQGVSPMVENDPNAYDNLKPPSDLLA